MLEGLKPEKVFYFFEEISKIPRGSGNTKEVSDYCVEFAKQRGLEVIQDELNNVIIKKPATKGRENDTGVILQGHLDMVAEKTHESKHDFLKDALELLVSGDWISAKDTTLGADDGIAVAYGLAILDSDDISHPALEVIFTIDEETGMDGARGLDLSGIKGKYMLNLDSEEEGIFVAGCAGGAKVKTRIPYRTNVSSGVKCVVKVSGLKGGHSGVEIDKERANADIIMARVLKDLLKNVKYECISINGGSKDNAIPRECSAKILIERENIGKAKEITDKIGEVIKAEYISSDSGLEVTFEMLEEAKEAVIAAEDFKNILFYLNSIPNGVMNMNPDIKGLVETSLNLGILTTDGKNITAVSAVRSSVGSRKQYIIDKLEAVAEIAGGFIEVRGDYPEWQFKKESKLRNVVADTYKELFDKEPVIDVIHAGLECGYISSRRPDIDIIAFGPDMCDIHTTEERLKISSVGRCYNLIIEVLKRLK